jgi:hypothetical protein
MRVRIVAIAAVRVRGVAVGLDDGRVGRRALEAACSCGELNQLALWPNLAWILQAYSSSLARADVIGKSVNVMRIAHEDSGLDGGESGACEGSSRAAAEGIIHDLTALVFKRN